MNQQDAQFRTQLPPNDVDAERCALGSMILCHSQDKQVFFETCKNLRADSFYLADHGIIFDAMMRMHNSGAAIDLVTLRADLVRAQLYNDVGGDDLLLKIINSVPSYAHGPHYANIVREKYMLREIIRVSNLALRRVMSSSNEDKAADICRQYHNELSEISCTGTADNIHRLSEIIERVLKDQREQKVKRIPTGLYEVDDMIGGLGLGRFTQIGGRPGMGKSLVCKQIAMNIAAKGIPCGIVSVEETEEKIGQNYLSNASGIENQKIAHNKLAEEDVNELIAAVPRLASLPIFISDTPVRMSEVENAISAMVMRHKCQVVIVDYLQLITLDDPTDNENREITKISKALKAAFKRLNVAGLVPVQLNRGNETGGVRRPALKDLRGSGSLEQDGDCIILLHREDYYHKGEKDYEPTNQIEAIVAKNKDGQGGIVPLKLDAGTQRVTDWPRNEDGPPPWIPNEEAA